MASVPDGLTVTRAVICPPDCAPTALAFTRIPTVPGTAGTVPIWIEVKVAPTGVAGSAKVTVLSLTLPGNAGPIPAVVVTTTVGRNPASGLLVMGTLLGRMVTLRLAPLPGITPEQLESVIVLMFSVSPWDRTRVGTMFEVQVAWPQALRAPARANHSAIPRTGQLCLVRLTTQLFYPTGPPVRKRKLSGGVLSVTASSPKTDIGLS